MFFLIIIGILLVILGAFECLKYNNKYSEYKEYTAEILGFRSRFETNESGEQEYLCAVAKYYEGDKEIHADHISYVPSNRAKSQRGDLVRIRVHSKSPEIFLYSEDTDGTSAFGMALVIGGLLTVVFHLLFRLIYGG